MKTVHAFKLSVKVYKLKSDFKKSYRKSVASKK